MNEQEIRLLVREAIARVGAGQANVAGQGNAGPVLPDRPGRGHTSHAMFVLAAGADTDGPCIIEPAVACNHCGFCKSYGY